MGAGKYAWLNALTNSNLNCICVPPENRTSLRSEKSTLLIGSRRTFANRSGNEAGRRWLTGLALVEVSVRTDVKAAVLNHLLVVLSVIAMSPPVVEAVGRRTRSGSPSGRCRRPGSASRRPGRADSAGPRQEPLALPNGQLVDAADRNPVGHVQVRDHLGRRRVRGVQVLGRLHPVRPRVGHADRVALREPLLHAELAGVVPRLAVVVRRGDVTELAGRAEAAASARSWRC